MTKKRKYRAHEPVLVTFRWAMRLDLFEQEAELRQLLRQLVAGWSVRCQVRVLGYAVRNNHAHLILVQRINDHDKERRKGIAAMMRNVLSQIGLAANATFGFEGRIIQKTYHAVKLTTVGDLVRRLAYVHNQAVHHGVPEDACGEDSSDVYYRHECDGVVTDIPLLPGLEKGLSRAQQTAVLTAQMDAIAEQAIRLLRRRRQAAARGEVLEGEEARACASPWKTATRIVARRFPHFSAKAATLGRRSLRSLTAHTRARRALLQWQRSEFLTAEAPPARLDCPLELRVTRVVVTRQE